MKRAIVTCVLALLPMLITAQQLSKSDFARGAEIRSGEGSIFRVLLPDDLYKTVTRADLGDVRVLNGNGDTVPHTLRRAPQPSATDASWLAVPSFPMSDRLRGGSARTQVKIDTTGAVLEVTGASARQATTAYLVDVSAIKDPLNRLALSWNAPAGVSFLTRVRVDGSNDLNVWRTLVASAALAQLQRDTFTLTQNEIELPQNNAPVRYFRISWPGDLSSVVLTAVRVRPRPAAVEAPIRWVDLTIDHIAPSGEAVFDSKALLPIEYVDLDFGGTADAVNVAVSSRPTPDAPWQWRHAGVFYALQEANATVRSAPAHIAPATDRYWSLKRLESGAWASGRVPHLKVGWHPHELVFVASGRPPYTLVYGSARVAAADAPVGAVLASLDEAQRSSQVREATLDPSYDLGGSAALTPPPKRRPIVLWSVLAVAVALLAWIAVRTFRETNRPPGVPPVASEPR